MSKEIQNFEEIVSESRLLDSEMADLRGGTEPPKIKCGEGTIALCAIGTDELGPSK